MATLSHSGKQRAWRGSLSVIALALVLLIAVAAAQDSEARVCFFSQPRANPGERLIVKFDDGSGWRRGIFQESQADEQDCDRPIRSFGRLLVQADLVKNGRRLATTRVVVPVQGDRRYLLHVAVQEDDPTATCIGCSEPSSAPVRGGRESTQRLWLYWTFNGISRPILF